MSKRVIHEDEAEAKKLNGSFAKEDVKQFFNSKIWSSDFQSDLQRSVAESQPYRWGTITELMDDTLLRQVRKEVLSEIAFTKKETDIYKVFQSGDLANLSGLNWDDLSRLPSLYKLRSGIYSEQFRDAISKITGCGKLSGVKTDMSINTYNKGCHLLTHDDVIGSRRVSFILYLPEPNKTWKPQYGGALRLFPSIVPNVPDTDFHCKLVPQFNQIAFFTVQPGLSFHDVEEVRVDRQRLSIQGWFHIPQPGEDGFIEGEQAETEARSTLQQLQSKELQEFDFPKPTRENIHQAEQDEEFAGELDGETLKYLSKYINPLYLHKENLSKLNVSFSEESIVEINNILKEEYAESLRTLLKTEELEKGQPKTASEISTPWKCAIPPHKQRYMYIDGKELTFSMTDASIQKANKSVEKPNFNNPLLAKEDADKKLLEIGTLLSSKAFRKWLRVVTDLIATSEQILVRRFRPGQDFILATTTDKKIARNDEELNVLLEATLNLTPTAINKKNWESGEFGGYELCMATSGSDSDDEGENEDDEDDPAIYKASGPNDDSVLYTSHCKWNTLSLMLRDPTVLKFVKYVSINAKGSRWDVSCQWNVKDGGEDDEDDEEAAK